LPNVKFASNNSIDLQVTISSILNAIVRFLCFRCCAQIPLDVNVTVKNLEIFTPYSQPMAVAKYHISSRSFQAGLWTLAEIVEAVALEPCCETASPS